MSNPGEMIRRARENRVRRERMPKAPSSVPEAQPKPAAVQTTGHRGAYTEIMRNHDRVGTRHIGKQN